MYQRQVFDAGLKDLQMKLLRMGGDVQEALIQAVDALCVLDGAKAAIVVEGDIAINRQEHDIEDLCIRMIATQQPVATDLRKIVAGMRIASDLERMADLAVDVAKSCLRLQGETLMKPLVDVPNMAKLLDAMIENALRAYIDNRVELAEQLAGADDEVDHLYRQMVQELFAEEYNDVKRVQQAMTLAFVGRYLERIGDHATNIGESVIYIVSGERSDLN